MSKKIMKAVLSLGLASSFIITGNFNIVKASQANDFAQMTPDQQEANYGNKMFFKPVDQNGIKSFVGDPMPYYENGKYYMYYLKDGGDSFRHSIYLATTKDFVNYEEYKKPIIETEGIGQEEWIGTGSMVKVKNEYLYFYTAHANTDATGFKETIRVAKGNNLTDLKKDKKFEVTPPEDIHQKNDFRDPQVYYDKKTKKLSMTVTASKDGVARILKYSISENLKEVKYDGIIFTEPTGVFWNLECTDTFKLGNRWYITYSAQDDTLWYASSDSQFGPYSEPKRLEGKLFYAAKHVEDGKNTYMVGWSRRSDQTTSMDVNAWAGNLVVQQLKVNSDGSLYLAPVKNYVSTLKAGQRSKFNHFTQTSETYMIRGSFSYKSLGNFGLSFGYSDDANQNKLITINPQDNTLELNYENGKKLITKVNAPLKPGKKYSFTYINDGSTGVFYIDKIAALTVRLHGVTGKNVYLYTKNDSVKFSGMEIYRKN